MAFGEVRFERDLERPPASGSWPETFDLRRLESGSWQSSGDGDHLFGLTPGMPRVLGSLKPASLALAMGCFLVALSFGITRWWRLLRRAGAPVRWSDSFRLTFLGLFFNLVMPGLTGGDVIKAVLAVREHPRQRADALVSVVVDRLFGLYTLTLLAAVVLLFQGQRFPGFQIPFVVASLGMTAGALIYTHPGLRRRLRIDALLSRLPLGDKLEKLDRAALLYTSHPGEVLIAMLLSLGNHAFAILGMLVLGRGFGVPAEALGLLDYMAIVPLANMASSIPSGPVGLGIGEAAYAGLFKLLGVSAALGVATSLGFRICQIVLGLLGGLFLLRPDRRAEFRAAEAVAELNPGESPTLL